MSAIVRGSFSMDALEDSELIRRYSVDQSRKQGSNVIREALKAYYGIDQPEEQQSEDLARIEQKLDALLELLSVVLPAIEKLSIGGVTITPNTELDGGAKEPEDATLKQNLSLSMSKFRH